MAQHEIMDEFTHNGLLVQPLQTRAPGCGGRVPQREGEQTPREAAQQPAGVF